MYTTDTHNESEDFFLATDNPSKSPTDILKEIKMKHVWQVNDASTNLLAMDLDKSAGVCDDASIHLLHKLRIENINNVIVSLLNVNSFSSKFDDIKFLIKENVDVAIFVETKIDDSYPNSQFMIDGFAEPFRFDRNKFLCL